MTNRTEFGFERTTCGCKDCQTNCRFMPGFLIPADLERMIPKGADPFEWAKRNLLASPGATVMKQGRIITVPTLVPAVNRETGHCVHLENGLCQIHPVAPFGCAFFDCTQTKAESDVISREGLITIMQAWSAGGLYAQLWRYLDRHGKRQKSPDVLRRRMAQEHK